jgi:hypothetical protein
MFLTRGGTLNPTKGMAATREFMAAKSAVLRTISEA